MTTTAADVAERMGNMLANHPKVQYLRITREEAEALATLRKDPAPTLTLPLPLRDFKGGTFHDGAAALTLKVLGTDAAVADYVGTDPTTGGYAGYADQQLVSKVMAIDRGLRAVIEDAHLRLHQLHNAGRLPTEFGRSGANQTRADVIESTAYVQAMRDGIHYVLARQRREAEEVAPKT